MKLITQIIILFTVAVWIIWDFVVAFSGHPDAEITEVLWQWGTHFPILPMALGALLGHLWWPQHYPVYPPDFNKEDWSVICQYMDDNPYVCRK